MSGSIDLAMRPLRPPAGRVTGLAGTAVLLLVAVPCFVTLPWSLRYYDEQHLEGDIPPRPLSLAEPLGTDSLARSMLWRCLLGGSISLGIGLASTAIALGIGVGWGATAAYAGGRVDAVMMRIVDVLYGLPYILLVVLLDLALKGPAESTMRLVLPAQAAAQVADLATLLLAIGGISWLTMARVIRGQVLSLRAQLFIEAARACGVGPGRLFVHHLLPNLIGPIVVYATLTVPVAILQESFLSFLGIGVQLPLPSWGNLAAEGMDHIHAILYHIGTQRPWWLLLWPCLFLGLTLMALNLVGESLRRRWVPHLRR